MKSIEIEEDAADMLEKLPSNDRRRIVEKIKQLSAFPNDLQNNIILLKNTPCSRLRVGQWRIIFRETETTFYILDVMPRGKDYKGYR